MKDTHGKFQSCKSIIEEYEKWNKKPIKIILKIQNSKNKDMNGSCKSVIQRTQKKSPS